MSTISQLSGKGGVVVLPVSDPAVGVYIEYPQAQICDGCVTDGGGSGAEYVIWINRSEERTYWMLCPRCLDRIAAFFRWAGA